MLVENILPASREKLLTIRDTAPLMEAAKPLNGKDANLVVVCSSDGMMVGVITKTDVVRQISHCQGSSCTMAAAAVMTRDVAYCQPHDLLTDVWSTMKQRGLRHMPVADQELRPIGVLDARQVVQALMDAVEHEEQILVDYVMCVGYR
jgi:signal-transduction protein with cAMP-binding, CBS, and nucleotidyltransferase domain